MAKRKRNRIPRLTSKEALFAEARMEGATLEEATRTAGYAPHRQQGFKVEQRIAEKAPEVFNRIGLTVERFGKKLEQLLDAKEVKHFANKGIVLDTKEVEALDIQSRAVDMGLRTHGAYKQGEEDKGQAQADRHMVTVFVADEEEAARLAQLLSARVVPEIAIRNQATADNG